jgi:hypothetical protein
MASAVALRLLPAAGRAGAQSTGASPVTVAWDNGLSVYHGPIGAFTEYAHDTGRRRARQFGHRHQYGLGSRSGPAAWGRLPADGALQPAGRGSGRLRQQSGRRRGQPDSERAIVFRAQLNLQPTL